MAYSHYTSLPRATWDLYLEGVRDWYQQPPQTSWTTPTRQPTMTNTRSTTQRCWWLATRIMIRDKMDTHTTSVGTTIISKCISMVSPPVQIAGWRRNCLPRWCSRLQRQSPGGSARGKSEHNIRGGCKQVKFASLQFREIAVKMYWHQQCAEICLSNNEEKIR